MKLIIIPADKVVYQDEVSILRLDWEGTPINVHALQWKDTEGWIEFTDGTPNETITALPDWALNAQIAWQTLHDKALAEPSPPTTEVNKNIAVGLLQKTDWSTVPDVSDPNKSNPYLVNSAEFIAYRNTIRQIAINPVAGNIVWATIPTAIWSN